MATSTVTDELWEDFHRQVNMTSRELGDFLRLQAADETTEALPDQAGTSLGRRVLGVLGKRRTDLTDDDVQAMEKAVRLIGEQRGEEPEPTAGDDHWRRRLMALGHDPLKPA